MGDSLQKPYPKKMPCPCRSGKDYEVCSLPFHNGKKVENVLDLMRSRFAAYALDIPEYIIDTTHPASPQWYSNVKEWTRNIKEFSANYTFKNLLILESQQNASFGRVTFFAELIHNGDRGDASFTERSYFEKVKEKWLYQNGVVSKGYDSTIVSKNT